MKLDAKLFATASGVFALSACGSFDGINDNVERAVPPSAERQAGSGVSDVPVKIGEPYQVDGRTYTPAEVGSYDEVGYASWYGEELAGNATANGERFNPEAISAAHKTLPLPSYVEVTALETGRTILVRVNDRGPFANDRLIDLSYGAAKQLGIVEQGISGVRVRKVNPNDQERAVLRSGGPAAERIATPDSLLTILRKNLAKQPRPANVVRRAAAPVATPPPQPLPGVSYADPPPASNGTASNRDGKFIIENAGTARSMPAAPAPKGEASGYIVQVAAFGDRSRADRLARQLGASVAGDQAGRIWRVRFGPFSSENAAQQALETARQRGFDDARILRAGR